MINRIIFEEKINIESMIKKYKVQMKAIDRVFNEFYADKLKTLYFLKEDTNKGYLEHRTKNNINIEMSYIPDFKNYSIATLIRKDYPDRNFECTWAFHAYFKNMFTRHNYNITFFHIEEGTGFYEDRLFLWDAHLVWTEKEMIAYLWYSHYCQRPKRVEPFDLYRFDWKFISNPMFMIIMREDNITVITKEYSYYKLLFYKINMKVLSDILRLLKSKDLRDKL
jgi:hypothetical protein